MLTEGLGDGGRSSAGLLSPPGSSWYCFRFWLWLRSLFLLLPQPFPSLLDLRDACSLSLVSADITTDVMIDRLVEPIASYAPHFPFFHCPTQRTHAGPSSCHGLSLAVLKHKLREIKNGFRLLLILWWVAGRSELPVLDRPCHLRYVARAHVPSFCSNLSSRLLRSRITCASQRQGARRILGKSVFRRKSYQ